MTDADSLQTAFNSLLPANLGTVMSTHLWKSDDMTIAFEGEIPAWQLHALMWDLATSLEAKGAEEIEPESFHIGNNRMLAVWFVEARTASGVAAAIKAAAISLGSEIERDGEDNYNAFLDLMDSAPDERKRGMVGACKEYAKVRGMWPPEVGKESVPAESLMYDEPIDRQQAVAAIEEFTRRFTWEHGDVLVRYDLGLTTKRIISLAPVGFAQVRGTEVISQCPLPEYVDTSHETDEAWE